jgi:glycosyltransferase involved in cell wall biosynthesis
MRILPDAVRIARLLSAADVDMVLLNPSLNFRALARDAVTHMFARRNGKMTVVMMHGWSRSTQRAIERGLRYPFGWFFGSADTFIVLCDEFRNALRAFGYVGPIHVMSTVVDGLCATAAAERSNADAFKDRRINQQSVRLLFLSRLVAEKGVLECLEAMPDLQRLLPGIRLLIAGDGPAADTVQSWVDAHPAVAVKVLGDTRGETKAGAFAEADIFLLPTRYGEGMPTVVLEALSYGLVPVVTAVAGIRDLVAHGVPVIILSDPGPKGIVGCVAELARDEVRLRRLAEEGPRAVLEYFVPDQVAGRFRTIFQKTVEESSEEIDWWEG